MKKEFLDGAPCANPVFYRTYSRRSQSDREGWNEVIIRSIRGLTETGKLTSSQSELIEWAMRNHYCYPSGRWLWVGGTPWLTNPENYKGSYNCTGTNIDSLEMLAQQMHFAMAGSGTGCVLEDKYINKIPHVKNKLTIAIRGNAGDLEKELRREKTVKVYRKDRVEIILGDSRHGWVDGYLEVLKLATNDNEFFCSRLEDNSILVEINISSIRPEGEPIKGFGGVANPTKLIEMFSRIEVVLNNAIGRQLSSVELWLLKDEVALGVVAGNVRRSAGMVQSSSEDVSFAHAKDNLWEKDDAGKWRIDPARDALRMSNATRVYHHKPTLDEMREAVTKQYYTGEGAIMFAPESIARSNADLLHSDSLRNLFIETYIKDVSKASDLLSDLYKGMHFIDIERKELEHRLGRYSLNPCVTKETWIHTEFGPRQVKELIDIQHGTYVNGDLFSTTKNGFFYTGEKPVFKITTREGLSLRLTGNHQLLKVKAQTPNRQYLEWTEVQNLSIGDQLSIHNHRGIQPWLGNGTFDEGWLLGSLVGDGSLAKTEWNDQGLLRFWGESQKEMSEYAIVKCGVNLAGSYHPSHNLHQVSSSGLAHLEDRFGIRCGQKGVTSEVERSSYDFHCGFLRGLFDADGSVQGSQQKGISIRLSQSNLATLESVQRMLLRIGIVSVIYQNRRPEGVRLMPDSNRNLAPYFCQSQHELVIANDNLLGFQNRVGFQQPEKKAKLTDLLGNYKRKMNRDRFTVTISEITPDGVESVYDCTVPLVSQFDANGFVAHNCGEILGSDFHCNLSEINLNTIDPYDFETQKKAFKSGAITVASLLHHKFPEPRFQYSRKIDPIVGVACTGIFDFFATLFGHHWLRWWESGRGDYTLSLDQIDPTLGNVLSSDNLFPRVTDTNGIYDIASFFRSVEQMYLQMWKETVYKELYHYCSHHGLRVPNRYTTVQPSGSKSLLTNASCGWHPPKSNRYIRRITFRKNDPVAMACIDYGYTVIPSQSDKDENGNLLDDPFDPRCTEWLVEIPVEVGYANIADDIDFSSFPIESQFDFYMTVQNHYTTHNTSSTFEIFESEIESLSQLLYENICSNGGYISSAILSRSTGNTTYPRLPFEPVSKSVYEQLHSDVLKRRKNDDFHALLRQYDNPQDVLSGPAGCDSDKCLLPEKR